MRAVLDTNVLISALLSPTGPPAQLLREWLAGRFELIVSDKLLAELERALAYPKLSRAVTVDERAAVLGYLRRHATREPDPPAPAVEGVRDPDDEFLVALAASARSALVTGDRDLLGLSGDYPIYSPRSFVELLEPA